MFALMGMRDALTTFPIPDDDVETVQEEGTVWNAAENSHAIPEECLTVRRKTEQRHVPEPYRTLRRKLVH